VFLSTTSVKGEWAGVAPFEATEAVPGGPLAALTRATVKPSVAARFWKRVPNISAMIGSDPNVAFKIGIGEVPLLHQVTFSIWPSEKAMAGFARTGPHAAAIRAVREEGWFREELYARFSVHSDLGSWNGSSPLSKLVTA
jgi:spheroidene monooxygenase